MYRSHYIYIHVPFCIKKCRYCDFYSQTDLDQISDYVTALVREIELQSQSNSPSPKGVAQTVYFGGGTPSVLGAHHLDAVLQALDKAFGLCTSTEVTLEANPGTLNDMDLKVFKSIGINRVSLGVQSFDPQKLSFLGRIHSADDAVNAVEKIRGAGIDNISLDLIYGLPGQTREHLIQELDTALALAPAHLSCYMLTLEPDTPLHALHKQGRLTSMAQPDQIDLFRVAAQYLNARGWDHYEISNFARQNTCRSRHNSAYWQMVPYHGFGPGAHAYTGAERSWNVPDVNGYIKALLSGKRPPWDSETLTLEQQQMEYFMVGLRTSMGIDIKTGKNLWQKRFTTVFQKMMDDLEKNGFARFQDAGQRFALTLEGWMHLDGIIAAFIEKI